MAMIVSLKEIGDTFSRTQIWEYHTGCGGIAPVHSGVGGNLNDGIGVYSFALKPEEHQPSGTCNFSRIDNAQFVQTTGKHMHYSIRRQLQRPPYHVWYGWSRIFQLKLKYTR